MEYSETSPEFYACKLFHIRLLTKLVGIGGIASVFALFATGMIYFEWQVYDPLVDIVALMGFFIFLIAGLITHYLVLYGIKRNRGRYLTPCLTYHLFLLILNIITAMMAVGELISDDKTLYDDSSLYYAYYLSTALPIGVLVNLAVVFILNHSKFYLRRRARWLRMNRHPGVREVMDVPISFHNKIYVISGSEQSGQSNGIPLPEGSRSEETVTEVPGTIKQ